LGPHVTLLYQRGQGRRLKKENWESRFAAFAGRLGGTSCMARCLDPRRVSTALGPVRPGPGSVATLLTAMMPRDRGALATEGGQFATARVIEWFVPSCTLHTYNCTDRLEYVVAGIRSGD